MGSFFEQYDDVTEFRPLSAVAAMNLTITALRAFEGIRSLVHEEQCDVVALASRKVALEAASLGITRQTAAMVTAMVPDLLGSAIPAIETFDLIPASVTDPRTTAVVSALKAPFGQPQREAFGNWLSTVHSNLMSALDLALLQVRDAQVRLLAAQTAIHKVDSDTGLEGLIVETIPADSLGELTLRLKDALEAYTSFDPVLLVSDPAYRDTLAAERATFTESLSGSLGITVTDGYVSWYNANERGDGDYTAREASAFDLGYSKDVTVALLEAAAECVDQTGRVLTTANETLSSFLTLASLTKDLTDQTDLSPIRMTASSHVLQLVALLDGSILNTLTVLGAVEALCS